MIYIYHDNLSCYDDKLNTILQMFGNTKKG